MKKLLTYLLATLGLTTACGQQNFENADVQEFAELIADKTIAVYYRSGRRSANAAGRLADVGYKCVNLKGGIIAWQGANMPVVEE